MAAEHPIDYTEAVAQFPRAAQILAQLLTHDTSMLDLADVVEEMYEQSKHEHKDVAAMMLPDRALFSKNVMIDVHNAARHANFVIDGAERCVHQDPALEAARAIVQRFAAEARSRVIRDTHRAVATIDSARLNWGLAPV